MTTIERCPHPHAWPAIECTGVKLARARRTPVCMCAHPKAVHEHWRKGLDCGMCDCNHYENARRASPCRCGHPQKAHEHYNWREHCSLCRCPEYSNPNGIRWLAGLCAGSTLVLTVAIWVVMRWVMG